MERVQGAIDIRRAASEAPQARSERSVSKACVLDVRLKVCVSQIPSHAVAMTGAFAFMNAAGPQLVYIRSRR